MHVTVAVGLIAIHASPSEGGWSSITWRSALHALLNVQVARHRRTIKIFKSDSPFRSMAALAKIFGSSQRKGETPTPQTAILKLRETEDMLSKKSEFLENKIEKETALAKKHGMKNKRGIAQKTSRRVFIVKITVRIPTIILKFM